jgi:5-methylcytosine-specific restriction endonuclease McrA
MATCPHCLGALTDDHRCPRKRHVRLAWTAAGAIGGAIAGFVVMAAIDPAQRSTEWDVWVTTATAVIAAAMCYRLTRA